MTRDHPRLFFDTRRILPSTPRRFFGSLEESKGARIKITPTVRDQLIRVLPTLEMNHYQKTIRTVQHKRKKSEIIKKTGRVSEEWITGELDSANSAESIFECIDPNHEHRFDIGNIEYYIPDYCFKKEQSLAIMADKRIVAETIFYKGQFLASSDKNTIYHDTLNEWAYKTFSDRTEELILTSDKLLDKIAPGKDGALSLAKICLGACLPDNPDEHIKEIVEKFRILLAKSDLPETARRIDEAIHTHPDIISLVNDVYENLPVRTRTTEDRRLEKLKEVEDEYALGL